MIDTARLSLHQPVIDDFEDLHKLTADPAMREHLSGYASVEDSYKRLLSTIGSWSVFGYGTFSVRERETGAYVGNCGLFRLLRGLGDGFDFYPEAGWIVAGSRWGRGYASEAMETALRWFEATHGPQRTACMIAPGNAASERIAARLGYRAFRDAEHRGAPVTLYARDPA